MLVGMLASGGWARRGGQAREELGRESRSGAGHTEPGVRSKPFNFTSFSSMNCTIPMDTIVLGWCTASSNVVPLHLFTHAAGD